MPESTDYKELIMVRLGELFLKGGNLKFFMKRQRQNIINGIKRHTEAYKMRMHNWRYLIEIEEPHKQEAVVATIKNIPGVTSVSVIRSVASEEEIVTRHALAWTEKSWENRPGTFSVRVKRNDKRFPVKSMDLAREIGGRIKTRSGRKVDLKNAELKLHIEIENDGFQINAEVKIDMDAESLYATAQAIGSGVLAISNALAEIKPDIMVVYADRFEGFAAVIASSQMNIPTAHIEGGDITEGGALDDLLRHSITKLSHLHFVTNTKAYKNLINFGEEKWRIKRIGLTSLDNLKNMKILSFKQLMQKYKIIDHKKFIIFTLHPLPNNLDQTKMDIENSRKSYFEIF